MASFHVHTLFFSCLILTSTFFITTHAVFSEQFPVTETTADSVNKMSHLHFYFHDVRSGKNPTAMRIAGPKDTFGTTVMIDDPLTEGPEPSSKIVGRAQGMYALASQEDTTYRMVMNFAFMESKYNGSSIGILGRNMIFDSVREMPIVGGSGLFRFASGYALAKTVRHNKKTRDAVVEYNVFVVHG